MDAGAQEARLARLVVAVDGPGGSGKSTTARGVARRLGLRYLDTGALYRALTLAMLRAGVDVHDPGAVARHASTPRIEVGTDPDAPTVTLDGADVAVEIRGREVTAVVSAVSAVPTVRQRLLAVQRAAIGDGGIVVEGRDIGSVVAPDAAVKVFLTAAAGERARRRTADFATLPAEAVSEGARGGRPEQAPVTTLDQTRRDLVRRDQLDSSREVSPLTQAPDAVVIDTTDLTVDEAVDRVCDLVAARLSGTT